MWSERSTAASRAALTKNLPPTELRDLRSRSQAPRPAAQGVNGPSGGGALPRAHLRALQPTLQPSRRRRRRPPRTQVRTVRAYRPSVVGARARCFPNQPRRPPHPAGPTGCREGDGSTTSLSWCCGRAAAAAEWRRWRRRLLGTCSSRQPTRQGWLAGCGPSLCGISAPVAS